MQSVTSCRRATICEGVSHVDRPVFELGPDAELPVRLGGDPIDEPLVLVADEGGAGDEERSAIRVRTLSLVTGGADTTGRIIELDVESGAGESRTDTCRYALGGGPGRGAR